MSQNDLNVSPNSPQFKILDSMMDGVRLINKYKVVIHTNQYVEENMVAHTIGKKCYEGIGKREVCKACIADGTFETGATEKKYETINGRHYLVITSPVYDRYQNINAVVEVFRDITKEKELEDSLLQKNEKMRKDIEFAQKMQANMLPLKGKYFDLQVNYFYRPSELLSGDMFDVFNIDPFHTVLYICDVMGHGVSSSMISMYVKQTMRAICRKKDDLNHIMRELHQTFLALNFEDDQYFSIFMAIFDQPNRTLHYVNAGHNCEPLLKRNGRIKKLKAKGHPICNAFDKIEYEEHVISLEKGDNLLFYTDGITEMKNASGVFFGEERLWKAFEERADIIQSIGTYIENFEGEGNDDLALLDIKVI